MELYDYDADLECISHFNMQIIHGIVDVLPFVFPAMLLFLGAFIVKYVTGTDYIMSFVWNNQNGYLEFITMITMIASTCCLGYLTHRIIMETESYILLIKKERDESLEKNAKLEEKLAAMKLAFKQIVIFSENEEMKLLA